MPVEEQLFQASNKFRQTNQVDGIRALHDHVIVRDMNFSGRQLSSGIYLLNDDGKTEGIRPRWAQVYAVGPDQKDIAVGQWVFIEHGRWSRGLEVEIDGEEFTLRKADPKCIIFASDEEPNQDETVSTAVMAERKSRTQFE
jgi:co-chaperonin GroES (HSP10)